MTASETPHPSPEKALPAPSDTAAAAPTATLDLSTEGSTVKLDALGPMVVSKDGTMSRITNWSKMTEVERESTLRIIGKRNQTRLAALRKAYDSKP